jgi:hypothetical protein
MRTKTVILISALAVFCGGFQLSSGEPPSVEIRESDWQISDWAAVRRGQAGVLHARGGDDLRVYLISASRPAVRASRIRSLTPSFSGNHYLVSSFDEGLRNRLGGYFSPFFSFPSSASTAIRRWEDGRRALTLDSSRLGTGYCGMWVHLFDFNQGFEERVYFDASPFGFLSFWIRGEEGNEKTLLKLSDAAWEKKEDAVTIGEIGDFLPEKTSGKAWQPALVPLTRLPPSLNRRQLAALIIEAVGPGMSRIAIKDLAFCRDGIPAPLSPPSAPPEGEPKPEKAMWIWNTADILANPQRQKELVSFSRRVGVSHLYLQLPNEARNLGASGEVELEEGKWKPFLELLGSNGLRADALDGFKNYALSEWHARVLMTVDNVIRFNRSVESSQRFRGIHYDIEPYLLDGYQGPRRERILQGYLHLIEGIAAKARSAGLMFGVDIPFWYDSPDELTGSPYRLEFGGRKKLPSEHVIDLVDQANVMDYRTSAYGADGVIAHVQGELAYAMAEGKRIFVGLETRELPDEELLDFEGAPSRGVPVQIPSGLCILVVPGSPNARMYLVSPAQWDWVRSMLDSGGKDPQSLLWWSVGKATPIFSHRLTFSRLGGERLDQTMSETQEELLRLRSFAGFAIHDYLGYRRLLGMLPY